MLNLRHERGEHVSISLIWLSVLWILSAVWNVLMQNNWMPFCGAFLAGRTWRCWLPCSPQHRQAVCVCPGLSSSRAVPSLQPGRDFCLAALLSPSLHAGSGVCRSRLLHSSSGELSAFSLLCATLLTVQHVNLCSTELCHLKACGFFLFPSLVVFFLYSLPRELFSRGEQPVSYSAAGCKLPKAYKIKLVLVINPLVHYL